MRVTAWIATAIVLACATNAHAAAEHYEYDALGRLIRYVNPKGELTEYVYDAVGNILEVRRSTDVGPPTITLVSPATVRRGQTVTVQVEGTRLAGALVTSPHSTLVVAGLSSTATLLRFDLSAGPTAPLGAQSFSVSNSFGSAGFSLAVLPALPTVAVTPSPIVLPVAGQQQVTLRLSNPDQIAHAVAVSVANPAVASVVPSSVEFALGQTEATVTVTALALGITALNLASATLEGASVGIQVTSVPTGAGTRYAQNVGVLRQAGQQVDITGPIVAPNVGVVRAADQQIVIGPIVAPSVGIVRAGEQQTVIGPLVAPNVGVDRQ